MAKLFPPRPQYDKERASFAYPIFACFAVLFAARCIDKFFGIELGGMLAVFILSLLAFLLPSLAFSRWRGRGYMRTLRFRPVYFTHVPLLIFAFLALFSASTLLSIVFGGVETVGNSTTSFGGVTLDGVGKIVLMIPLLALVPAVLEELLFRGILCSELDRRGILRTVIVSALLFALVHFDLANFPFYLLAGVLLALVLYATDSLIATMIVHAAYNLASLFGRRYLNTFYRFTGSAELFLFLLILVLLVSLLLFTSECARLYRMRARLGLREPRRSVPMGVQLYTFIDALCEWPVIACIVLSIVGLIVL